MNITWFLQVLDALAHDGGSTIRNAGEVFSFKGRRLIVFIIERSVFLVYGSPASTCLPE